MLLLADELGDLRQLGFEAVHLRDGAGVTFLDAERKRIDVALQIDGARLEHHDIRALRLRVVCILDRGRRRRRRALGAELCVN